MDVNVKIPRSFVQPPFDRWYRALVLVNTKAKNKPLVLQYFLQEFSNLKQDFYLFVLKIKKQLKSGKNKSLNKNIAQKYLTYISSLCERFGFFEEKSEIDDIAFRLTCPKEYQKIKDDLEAYKLDSQGIIKSILQKLESVLRESGYHSRVSGRYKNLYSIYRKNRRKRKKNIFELNDIFAFRIIVRDNQVEKCFSILTLFHDLFVPVPQYFKNYIDIPKVNGYKSLHTGVNGIIPNFQFPVEIQIRTEVMNEYAEKGLASHWLYDQNKKSLMLNKKEQKSLSPFLNEGALDSVFCFSYQGDIFQLKKGSSIIDFAAKVHSDLPSAVRSANVNGATKTIRYKIKNGDFIHLVTDK